MNHLLNQLITQSLPPSFNQLINHSPIYSTNQATKVAYTAGLFFEKIMKRYPIFSLQINYHHIDQKHK